MQGSNGTFGAVLEEWKVQQVDVKMQHVELVGAPPYIMEHRQMCGEVLLQWRGIETYGLFTCRHERGVRTCVRCCKQRDVVPQADQRIDQMGDDALGTPIQFGRNGFVEWGDLGDFHGARLEC